MTDVACTDPYAGIETYEEQMAVYQKLQAQYQSDMEDYRQDEIERRKVIYDDQMKAWHYQRDAQRENDGLLHKYILTVAAGSFGVSFAFINQIVSLNTAVMMPVLATAWVLFAFSIVVALIGFKISSAVQDTLLDVVEENIQRGYEGKEPIAPKRRVVMFSTRIADWCALILFVMGVVCLLYFVLQNTMLA